MQWMYETKIKLAVMWWRWRIIENVSKEKSGWVNEEWTEWSERRVDESEGSFNVVYLLLSD